VCEMSSWLWVRGRDLDGECKQLRHRAGSFFHLHTSYEVQTGLGRRKNECTRVWVCSEVKLDRCRRREKWKTNVNDCSMAPCRFHFYMS